MIKRENNVLKKEESNMIQENEIPKYLKQKESKQMATTLFSHLRQKTRSRYIRIHKER